MQLRMDFEAFLYRFQFDIVGVGFLSKGDENRAELYQKQAVVSRSTRGLAWGVPGFEPETAKNATSDNKPLERKTATSRRTPKSGLLHGLNVYP
jgi:hypothetical protein